ncbi:hypothetical protein MSAN_01562600 [Mycena sanguinolenta]|uniref:F-box domain-containing protein n=1 Tax=Mycena sanguinolenta TaxID=230812 RepID=A0A8H7CX81_9AGAR|nr:hypothetical protein MSAN_01562600 [Mycena sanguinolenta]
MSMGSSDLLPLLSAPLMDLPVDNVFQVLKFADPRDIFAFGQTCTKYQEINKTRTVWINALRRVCEINSLFVPSFPYDEMSLSELQRAATFGASPRFARRLYKQQADAVPGSLTPCSWRIFTPRVAKSSNVASEEPGTLKALRIVPGGRFMVIATDTLVHLWDLGYDATKLIKPHALASIALPEPNSEPSISVLPTKDGIGLEVMIMAYNHDKNTVAIYHIFPLDARPEFICVAQTQVLTPFLRGFLAKPGYSVFRSDKNILVWDSARNLWSGWRAEEYPSHLFAYQDIIVGVGAKTITLWEAPLPNRDSDTITLSDLDTHLPLLTLSHPFPGRSGHGVEIGSSTDWFCATSIKPCFISISGFKENTRYIARYMMHSLHGPRNPNIPGSIPILMDQSPIADAADHLDYCEGIHPCGGNVFAAWTSESSSVIEVSISPMPIERKNEGPTFNSVLLFEYPGDRRPEDFDLSICPFAGRLCTVGGEGNEIIVLDFLKPGWKDEY